MIPDSPAAGVFVSLRQKVTACKAVAQFVARSAALVLAGALVGQSPLTTSYTGLGVGVPGSQIFFDLNVTNLTGITIKSLDVNLSSPAATIGTVSLLTQPGTYTVAAKTLIPGPWGLPAGVGGAVAEGVGKPTHVCLVPPVFLPFGVHAVALQFGVVAPQFTVNAPFPPPPIVTVARTEVVFSRGNYQPIPWLPIPPGTETFDGAIHYEPGATIPCVPCANKVSAGVGCASPCAPFPVLELDSGFPVLGETLELVTTGASPCATLGVTAFGFGLIGGGAGGPICLPSCLCLDYITLDATTIAFPILGTWTTSLPLPLSPSLCGVSFYAQSFTLEMPFAVVSSNYLALTTGS